MDVKRTEKQFSTKSGVALFIAILIASVALAIGAGVLNITLKQLKLASFGAGSTQAFFSADTGLECALKWDLHPPTEGESIFGYYSSAIAPLNSIVGYWKLDEKSPKTAAVDTFGGNDGTLVNMIGNEWTTGQVDGALSFDGVNDYVTTSVPVMSGNTVSYGGWFNANSLNCTGGSCLIAQQADVDNKGSLLYFRSGVIRCYDGANLVAGGNPVTVGQWYHAMCVHDGRNMSLYIDGNFIGSKLSSVPVANNNFLIGAGKVPVSSYYFNGKIDDIRAYNRALDATEVKALYDATAGGFIEPDSSPSSGLYSCASSDIVTNSAGNWSVSSLTNGAETIFYTENPCSSVTVTKEAGRTTIRSRGYNTCDTSSGRRVERGIRLGPY